ncbi:hypothetical protein [Alicyclobacillus vulcanalis]|uniref:Uncharacterized protein n=1 Tax=Alicyclobacillus vulcanalis TaxID=252246 RepID=A0A1N7PQX9_9BACL|nr:hypothetical protein [Alicyclobacillus vulcanalis]SIT12998.1 hypothetical protein SAMN05421799_11623 [Alicyclobacillus vulcanalis]
MGRISGKAFVSASVALVTAISVTSIVYAATRHEELSARALSHGPAVVAAKIKEAEDHKAPERQGDQKDQGVRNGHSSDAQESDQQDAQGRLTESVRRLVAETNQKIEAAHSELERALGQAKGNPTAISAAISAYEAQVQQALSQLQTEWGQLSTSAQASSSNTGNSTSNSTTGNATANSTGNNATSSSNSTSNVSTTSATSNED